MEYHYQTTGTCSKEIIIEIDGEIVKRVQIIGGCAGNAKGLTSLVEGMKIEEVIQKLRGIPCGTKGTSCPDQLAKALEEIKANQK